MRPFSVALSSGPNFKNGLDADARGANASGADASGSDAGFVFVSIGSAEKEKNV